MTSWIKSFNEHNTEFSRLPIVRRSRHSTHFQRGNGSLVAAITGAPQNFKKANGRWSALDPSLKFDGAGRLGAEGLLPRISTDGSISFGSRKYSQQTVSVGILNGNEFKKLADFPEGKIVKNKLVRDTENFRHEIILGERGIKEQLTVFRMPDALDSGVLAYETLVSNSPFRPGKTKGEAVGERKARFPIVSAKDGNGSEIEGVRNVLEGGGISRVYSGAKVEAVGEAEFPVVIDPVVNLEGDTADGQVRGNNGAWSLTRSTSKDFGTGGIEFRVGTQKITSAQWTVHRGFLKFDTSTIGVSGTVNQVNLKLTVTDYLTHEDGNYNVLIKKQNWSAQDPLSDGNREAAYDNCLASPQDDSIWQNTSSISGDFTTYISGSLDTSWLNLDGSTYYSLLSGFDQNNNAPNGKNQIDFCSADNSTGAYRPVLIVDYEAVLPNEVFVSLPDVSIGLYDTRFKLRAKARNTRLTTKVRS